MKRKKSAYTAPGLWTTGNVWQRGRLQKKGIRHGWLVGLCFGVEYSVLLTQDINKCIYFEYLKQGFQSCVKDLDPVFRDPYGIQSFPKYSEIGSDFMCIYYFYGERMNSFYQIFLGI